MEMYASGSVASTNKKNKRKAYTLIYPIASTKLLELPLLKYHAQTLAW